MFVYGERELEVRCARGGREGEMRGEDVRCTEGGEEGEVMSTG